MGDHFVLLVNRLITDSTIEAVIQSENRLQHREVSSARNIDIRPGGIDMEIFPSAGKLVQCRICHDEDQDSNMEIPCSCCGSLKYAHRRCIQRWCSEKGDTTCEICRQQFRPNYVAPPPPMLHYGGISMNFSRNWEVPMRDLHNSRFIVARVASDDELTDTEFDALSAVDASPRGLICCRVVAIIFMVLLVLRHTLPVLLIGAGEYSMTTLLMLMTVGILLLIYVMVRAFSAVQRQRRQSVSPLALTAIRDEENDLSEPHQSRFIHVH